jgi:hypothetical protein
MISNWGGWIRQTRDGAGGLKEVMVLWALAGVDRFFFSVFGETRSCRERQRVACARTTVQSDDPWESRLGTHQNCQLSWSVTEYNCPQLPIRL